MAKKNKRKLTEDQKRWLGKLKDYMASEITWEGDQDLKDVVEGKFVIFATNKDVPDNTFDIATGVETFPQADAVVDWNYSRVARIVDLESFETLREVKKPWGPTLDELLPERMKNES
jgi:hypothetical protein